MRAVPVPGIPICRCGFRGGAQAPLTASMELQPTPGDRDALFLPDFCDVRLILVAVLMGELLAFVLVLVPGPVVGFWDALSNVSLYVQWVGLTSMGLLCVGRRWLRRFGNMAAGLISYALVLGVTAAVSVAVCWLFPQVRDPVLPVAGIDPSFVGRNLAVAAIVTAVSLRYFYVQFQWKNNLESETQARIQALQSRIRPHFLFNSMNTIASLTRSRPEVAERAVEDLADLFRVSLGDARVPVTLRRELEVCRHYLEIEALRLGERLRTEWSVDDMSHDAVLPALSVQPLVENAVYHGIEPVTAGGVLAIGVAAEGGERVNVTIRNPVAADRTTSYRQGNRMALENVRERMQAFFGGQARLEVGMDGSEYQVSLTFPYRRAAA